MENESRRQLQLLIKIISCSRSRTKQPAETFSDSSFWMQFKNISLTSRQDLSQVKAVFEKKLGGISYLRFGGEYWYAFNKQPVQPGKPGYRI